MRETYYIAGATGARRFYSLLLSQGYKATIGYSPARRAFVITKVCDNNG